MKTNIGFISLLLFSIMMVGCKNNTNQNDYLRKVLKNLEKIESATYRCTMELWQPGDTVAKSTYCKFFKEYDNPTDSTIGASFIWFDCADTTKFESCYDGNIKAIADHDIKEIATNDFSSWSQPFRPVSPPFFNYAKNIVKYVLNTTDSIDTKLEDSGDHYYFKLVIHEDRQVEFFGKAYHMSKNSNDPTSIYELWISKSNDLPYKVRREMSHNISVATCSDVKISEQRINDFNAYAYFPQDYEIRKYGEASKTKPKFDLTGQKAPDWTSNDKNGQAVSLSDFKSKVLLINFTGIGCGVCQFSIPFLKSLKDTFKNEDFDLVAIEAWGGKTQSLQNYANKNNLNYNLLCVNDDIIKNYQIGGASMPIFFILDEQRMIRKVIDGYNEKTKSKEIMDTITEIISSSKKI